MPKFLSQKITSIIKWWWFDTTKLWRGLLHSNEQKECPTISLKMNFGLVSSLSLFTSRGLFFLGGKGNIFKGYVFEDMLSASFYTKWKYSTRYTGDQWYSSHVILPALAAVLELKPPGWDSACPALSHPPQYARFIYHWDSLTFFGTDSALLSTAYFLLLLFVYIVLHNRI